MSTVLHSDRAGEALFVTGVLVGTLVFSLGFVFLVLGLSTGVRQTEFLTSDGAKTAAMLGGIAVVAAGVGVRYVRHRLDDGGLVAALRHGGSLVVLVGLTTFLVGASANQTNSAPFLGTMTQKATLVVVSLVLMTVGAVGIRLAGRRIGW